jgi:hypothetical protein
MLVTRNSADFASQIPYAGYSKRARPRSTERQRGWLVGQARLVLESFLDIAKSQTFRTTLSCCSITLRLNLVSSTIDQLLKVLYQPTPTCSPGGILCTGLCLLTHD